MIAILSLLTGPTGKYVGYALLLVALLGSAWGALALHDAGVRSALEASQRAEQTAAALKATQAATVALGAAMQRSAVAAAEAQKIKDQIDATPSTTDCSNSAAVRAALDGVFAATPTRPHSGSAGTAHVPARAGTARRN